MLQLKRKDREMRSFFIDCLREQEGYSGRYQLPKFSVSNMMGL